MLGIFARPHVDLHHPPKTHVWPALLTIFKKTPPDDFDGYNADHNGSAEGVDFISKP